MKILSSKRILLSIPLIVLLIALLIWLFLKSPFGDLRPALLPSDGKLVETIEKQEVGEAVDFPLKLPEGYKIGIFAKDLSKARDLQFSPGGTLLLSIPDEGKVVALPDKNNDGKADEVKVILSKLRGPHGLAFHNGKLFVAEYTQLVRYSFNEQRLSATQEKKLFNIPADGGHSTRSLSINKDGQLLLSIGSSCNVCIEENPWFASVVVSNIEGESPRVFASGLRNSVFLKENPKTGEVWAGDMGRDLIGDDIPPEDVNIIRDGKNYGWPYCYGDQIHDGNFDPDNKQSCASTIAPIWKIQAHSAPLGLVFIDSSQFPQDWQGDLLMSFHGSWNRSVPTGYKIVRFDVQGNTISKQEDFISGFLQGSEALGRPVDLEFDKMGSLYISDDKIGVVYKLVKE